MPVNACQTNTLNTHAVGKMALQSRSSVIRYYSNIKYWYNDKVRKGWKMAINRYLSLGKMIINCVKFGYLVHT